MSPHGCFFYDTCLTTKFCFKYNYLLVITFDQIWNIFEISLEIFQKKERKKERNFTVKSVKIEINRAVNIMEMTHYGYMMQQRGLSSIILERF